MKNVRSTLEMRVAQYTIVETMADNASQTWYQDANEEAKFYLGLN